MSFKILVDLGVGGTTLLTGGKIASDVGAARDSLTGLKQMAGVLNYL